MGKGRPRKDYKPLNIHMDTNVYRQLEEICAATGQSKTVATEWAIRMYADAVLRKIKGGSHDGQENV